MQENLVLVLIQRRFIEAFSIITFLLVPAGKGVFATSTPAPAPKVTSGPMINVSSYNPGLDLINKINAQSEKLKKDNEEKARLAAIQAAQEARAAEQAKGQQQAKTAPIVYSGSHEDWMAAAGISPSDYGYVDYIVSHESGWRVNAQNPSGAYGLCQSLPGIKMASAGDDWSVNPVTQLRWCNQYASRYGGWSGAYSYWLSHNYW